MIQKIGEVEELAIRPRPLYFCEFNALHLRHQCRSISLAGRLQGFQLVALWLKMVLV